MLGGSALNALLTSEAHPDGLGRRSEWGHYVDLGAWGMAENPRTGHAMLLAAQGPDVVLRADFIGTPGYLFLAHVHGRIAPRQALEAVCYVVIGRDRDHVRTFAALAALHELP